jgi:hypothetical protein
MIAVPYWKEILVREPGDEPRKQKFRRFAEVMYMLPIYLHPRFRDKQRKQDLSLAIGNSQFNSFGRPGKVQLSYLVLGLMVLGGCIALTGCGGIVPASTASGTASASAGSFTATPNSVAFGSVTVGSPATSKISLVNGSSDPVVISKISASNASFSYDGVGTLPLTLAANSTTTLNVQFGPSSAGSATGSLVITSNSLVTPSATIQLSGNGILATAGLTVNSSTVAFGNVAVGTPSTQSVTLTSSGTAAVTVSAVSLSGTGFTMTGATFPLTLNSGQTATLSLQFEPTATGAATGNLTISSNASSNSTDVVALSGTGVPLAVDLSWSPPSSSDPIAGYNIYRAASSAASFARLNASVNSPSSFMDSTVTPGATYQYYVTTVDSSGTESTPSNTATVAVP